jgi:aconitate hydratase
LRAVLAKSFARIHAQNLVNFGVLPLTFSRPADYNDIHTGDVLRLDDVRRALAKGDHLAIVDATRGRTLEVHHFMSPRQVQYVLRGGLVNWMKERLAGSTAPPVT